MKTLCPYCMLETSCKKTEVTDEIKFKDKWYKVKSLVILCLDCRNAFNNNDVPATALTKLYKMAEQE